MASAVQDKNMLRHAPTSPVRTNAICPLREAHDTGKTQELEGGDGSSDAIFAARAADDGPGLVPTPVAHVPTSSIAAKPGAPASMRNLYTAAMSYNGFTITDGALRLVVLLAADDLGFTAIEIAFMFSMYEVRECDARTNPALVCIYCPIMACTRSHAERYHRRPVPVNLLC